MYNTDTFESPLGPITLGAHDGTLCGLWFEGQKYDRVNLPSDVKHDPTLPAFHQAKAWLETYFTGTDPGFTPPIALSGTAFQTVVWHLLSTIPFGQTITYGQLAAQVAQATGKERMSARAVGSAVGKNPLSLILPCHRVVGASNNLTGYAGGLKRKKALLELEGIAILEPKAQRPQ